MCHGASLNDTRKHALPTQNDGKMWAEVWAEKHKKKLPEVILQEPFLLIMIVTPSMMPDRSFRPDLLRWPVAVT